MGEIIIVEVEPGASDSIRAIGRLRSLAWSTVLPQAREEGMWIDRHDASARHWTATRGGELVAAARMSVHTSAADLPDLGSYPAEVLDGLEPPIASFNRLVVAASARGLGLSRKLDALRLAEAERSGCRCAVGATSAGPSRIRQLKSIGFHVACLSPDRREGHFAHRPTAEVAVLVRRIPSTSGRDRPI